MLGNHGLGLLDSFCRIHRIQFAGSTLVPSLLRLDLVDHRAPHLGVRGDPFRQIGRRARRRDPADGEKLILHFRIRKDFGDLCVETRDNRGGAADGRDEGIPELRAEVLGKSPLPGEHRNVRHNRERF
jgi:hypothetical protein